MKKLACLSLALLMVLTLLPVKVWAVTEMASGNCGANGSNAKWSLDEQGTLTISGKGKIADYGWGVPAPWTGHRNTIKKIVIASGITAVGEGSFSGCNALTVITLPNSVTSIDNGAFSGCSSLSSITIPKDVTFIGVRAFYGCSSLENVYYAGTKQKWNAIDIENGNDTLLNAVIQPLTINIGNINGISDIDATDMACLYEYLTTGNLGHLSEEDFFSVADLNDDNSVDVYDLQFLYEVVSGIKSIDDIPSSSNYHIGIVTGSYAQSEAERLGAEAFQREYGNDMVTLAIYPDDYTQELETTIQNIINLASDPLMKAIVVNQAVPGTTEAFRKVKEIRPDIICIAGESHEDLSEISSTADLVCNNDFISRGYLLVRTAFELNCDTFVHISFPRHMAYITMSRRVAVMKAACEEFGMQFILETAPDPTSDAGVSGAQAYILNMVPKWVEKYGENTAYFCTNDAHIEPLIKQLLEYGGYFIESDLPSPLIGYPGALGIDLSEESQNFEKALAKVESAVVEKGGSGHFGTWAYSYGYSLSAGLAQHAKNAIDGKSELTNINDVAVALQKYSPSAEWNGTYYTSSYGKKYDNIFLVYQDTYIMGNPGYFMGNAKVEIPQRYFTIN